MPTDTPNLLAALGDAAELGKAATKRPWNLDVDDAESSVKIVDDEGGIIGAVFGDDEFPCLEDDERPAVTKEAAATAKYVRAAANLDHAAIAQALRDKDAEIERLRSDVQVLKNAAKAAFDNLLAQQNGGRLLRRDTVIGILGAALTHAAGDAHA